MSLCFQRSWLLQAGKVGIVTVIALVSSACGTIPIAYDPKSITPERAVRVIEQVIMEQRSKERPEGVNFEHDYIEIEGGTSSNGRSTAVGVPIGGIVVASGRQRGQSKRLVTRIYFDSLIRTQLGKKRTFYIATIRNRDRMILQRVYIRNLNTACEFVDAMDSLVIKNSQ
jgi:hypothetical protein